MDFENIKSRLLITVVFLPLTVLALFLNNIIFYVFLFSFYGIIVWEFHKISDIRNNKFIFIFIVFLIFVPTLLSVVFQIFFDSNFTYVNFILLFILFFILIYKRYFNKTKNLDYFFWFYCISFGYCLSFIPHIISPEFGRWHFLFLLLIIWITDTGAFIIGNLFGKIKLAPLISQNKTVEGTIGGLIFGFIFGFIFNRYFHFSLSDLQLFLIIMTIPIMAVIGDLLESNLKRRAKIKDSSGIFLGHGGVIDRLDSVVPNILLFYLIMDLL